MHLINLNYYRNENYRSYRLPVYAFNGLFSN